MVAESWMLQSGWEDLVHILYSTYSGSWVAHIGDVLHPSWMCGYVSDDDELRNLFRLASLALNLNKGVSPPRVW